MTKGVILMNFGSKHFAHLVCCLYSLRRHYSGDIVILHDESNEELTKRIAEQDPKKITFPIRFKPFTREELGNGSGYLNKTRLIDLMPFARAVFLDCDTLVVDKFDALFPDSNEVRLTQFCDWKTNGNKMSKRIGRWKEVMNEQATLQMALEYPAINTGVMGLSKTSKNLSIEWQRVCRLNISFMCDELAMQLIFLKFPHVVLPDAYNCSPIYRTEDHKDEDVKIWHGHGQKFLRSSNGLRIYMPTLLEMWTDNTYCIREAFCSNRYFRRLEADPVAFIKEYAKDKADKIIESNGINEHTFN